MAAQGLGIITIGELNRMVTILAMGLVAGYFVGGLGVGWGAVLVPSLMLIGIYPTVAIQSSLLLQILIVPFGGLSHLRLGNIDKGIFFPLSITGILGASVGALTAVNLPEFWLKPLIGVATLGMGLLVLSKSPLLNGSNGQVEHKKVRVIYVGLIGVVAGFAAGAFGTGWGPISVSALILAGTVPKLAIGSSLLARALIALSGSTAYLALGRFQPDVLIPLLLGGGVAVILGALSSKKLNNGSIKSVIGVTVLILGFLTILKVIL